MTHDNHNEAADQPVHCVIDVTVHDDDAFQEYVRGHIPTITAHGGTFIIATDTPESIEGEWQPTLFLMHRWPSRAAFKRWYDSAEYKPWKAMRQGCSTAKIILVDEVSSETE